MASIPHLYSDYPFSSDEFSAITSVIGQETFVAGIGAGDAILVDDNFSLLVDDHNSYNVVPSGEFYNCDTMITPNPALATSATTASFPTSDRFGGSELLAIPTLSGYNNKIENFVGGFQLSDPCGYYREDCCAVVPNSTPNCCPAATESSYNWGMECTQMAGSPASDQHGNMKVGRYSVEERKERILRYLKKRNQRNFNKTIKYACRKTLADRRVRVRGRFARNNELFEEETEVKKLSDSYDHEHHRHHHSEKDLYSSDTAQMKMIYEDDDDDDEWLREAVASLMYVPYGVA